MKAPIEKAREREHSARIRDGYEVRHALPTDIISPQDAGRTRRELSHAFRPMPHEFKTTRRVEFPDTDMAGIMHFANFFKFMESAEHEFFRSHGLEMHVNGEERMAGWARVKATCNYLRPAHYPDLLEIHLRVGEITERTIQYAFAFRVVDEAGGELGPVIANGELTVIHVAKSRGDERMRSTLIPDEVARVIQTAPAES